MTSQATDMRELFISRDANGSSGGSVDRPFRDIDDAFLALEDDSPEERPQHTPPQPFDIVYLDCRGGNRRPASKPRFEFFVDRQAGNRQADGSELFPWPDFQSAAAGIKQLDAASKLRPGDRIRVRHRQVFTATRMEVARSRCETVAKYVLLTMALSLVLPVVLILVYLTMKAWPVLSLSFLLENPKNRMTAGGLWSPLIGTFSLVLTSLLIAAPIGVLAGVYLNEYAKDNWLTRMINLAVVNLAGVPSIVHGLFGVGAFVYFCRMSPSLLAAACTVAVMTLPVIITSTKEALASVPQSFREACWNLGASRWQTIRTIVLPNSISGILTGVILQVSRAAGETAPILFTGAVFYVRVADSGIESYLPYGLGDKFMALSYHLFALSTQVKDVSEQLQYGTAVVLIGLVLAVNALSIAFRVYLRSRKKW